MNTIEFTCPACGAAYRLQQQATMVLCQCSACQHEFYLEVNGKILPLNTAPAPHRDNAQATEEEHVSIPQDEDFDLNFSGDPPDPGILAFEQEPEPKADELAMDADDIPDMDESSEPDATDPEPAGQADREEKKIIPAEEIAREDTPPSAKGDTTDKEAANIIPPKRRKHRIWPWLLVLLLLLATAGLWYQRQAWIHHPVVRSVLLKTGLSHLASESDWLIDEQNITMHWESVGDGQPQALVLEGQVENRLRVPLPLPRFEAVFADEPDKPHPLYSIASKHLDEAIASAGEIKAEWYDQREVAAGESRHFILIMHNLDTKRALRVSLRAVPGS